MAAARQWATDSAELPGAAGAVVPGARLAAGVEAGRAGPEPQADTASNPDMQSARTAPERIIAFLFSGPVFESSMTVLPAECYLPQRVG